MSASPSRCVISLATADRRYPAALERLEQSLRQVGYTGSVLLWRPGSFPEGCPSHLDAPFAFKPACFAEARDRGFELVLWLDSACVAVRPLDPLFEAMEERGHVLFRNGGHILGEWASDLALDELGLTREKALRLPEIDAAAIGLNLREDTASEFLRRWHDHAARGLAFRGVERPLRDGADYGDVKWNRGQAVSVHPRVRGHRHDQTVAGALAHELGMELTPRGLQEYTRTHRLIRRTTLIVLDRSARDRARRIAPLGRIRRDRFLGPVTSPAAKLAGAVRLARRFLRRRRAA